MKPVNDHRLKGQEESESPFISELLRTLTDGLGRNEDIGAYDFELRELYRVALRREMTFAVLGIVVPALLFLWLVLLTHTFAVIGGCLFFLPFFPFILMSSDERKKSKYFLLAIELFRQGATKQMNLETDLFSDNDRVRNRRISKNSAIAVRLRPLEETVLDQESRNVLVFSPCSWQWVGDMNEVVNVYSDRSHDDMLVIDTSQGLLCSVPRNI